jgi:hypothetical protein
MKKTRKKLGLAKQTMRNLSGEAMDQVAGGVNTAGWPCSYLCTQGVVCKTPSCPQ